MKITLNSYEYDNYKPEIIINNMNKLFKMEKKDKVLEVGCGAGLFGQFLNKYNRFGIPFNAFYSKKYSEGVLLSELLSEKEILNNINKINND